MRWLLLETSMLDIIRQDIINGALVMLSSAGHINGQVDPDDLKWPAAKAASPLYVDTMADPTARDLAYHSIKHDHEFWPVRLDHACPW